MNTYNKIVFTENNRELWFFTISRPIKQYLLHYTFRIISKLNKVKVSK